MNLMIDIETLGAKPGCAILSIAAVPFKSPCDVECFYERISPESNTAVGLISEQATLDWWDKQSVEARAEAFSGDTPIEVVLFNLSTYISQFKDVQVWGNGASFDVPIIEYAMRKCMIDIPWRYSNEMCYRTLKNLFTNIPAEKPLVAHNALYDAKAQAAHATKILTYIYMVRDTITVEERKDGYS